MVSLLGLFWLHSAQYSAVLDHAVYIYTPSPAAASCRRGCHSEHWTMATRQSRARRCIMLSPWEFSTYTIYTIVVICHSSMHLTSLIQ